MGQQRFIGHRPKSKFRPRPEWFGEMLPKPESVVYEEQNDQPVLAISSNDSPFQDFILEDYDTHEKGYPIDEILKLPRQAKDVEVFQNLCKTIKKVIHTSTDPRFEQEYEYIPSVFKETYCKSLSEFKKNVEIVYHTLAPLGSYPYIGKGSNNHHLSVNKVCSKNYGNCIPTNSTLHLSRRLKVGPGEVNENCWEPISTIIASNCQCMWPKHKLGMNNGD